MTYRANDIVKFIGNKEPCIVYHVTDPVEQWIWNEKFNSVIPHVKLEVIGMVPVEYITPARSVVGNVFALDYKLFHQGELN